MARVEHGTPGSWPGQPRLTSSQSCSRQAAPRESTETRLLVAPTRALPHRWCDIGSPRARGGDADQANRGSGSTR